MEFDEILVGTPKYRIDQIYHAWFNPSISSYSQISTLPKDLREQLNDQTWMTVKLKTLQTSKIDGTQKALLELADGNFIETVLMGRKNKRATREADERFTICISSQVGCPMGCIFCATGKMGFKRNLTAREIIDQVRFWLARLDHPRTDGSPSPISNIVLMGQGEPLLNYNNIKEALNIILKYGGLGPRQITLSTVGVPSVMEKMVADKDWPPVRFALSLHNPIEDERKKLIPSHQKDFLNFLVDWSKKYHDRFSARTQFIGLEYTIVPGENDTEKHLKAMIKLASKLGKVRINLIPLNNSVTCHPERSEGSTPHKRPDTDPCSTAEANGCTRSVPQDDNRKKSSIDYWHERLMECGFTTTIRRSQGQDIAAACGQLALNELKCQ